MGCLCCCCKRSPDEEPIASPNKLVPSQKENKSFEAKIVLLGTTGVGKSSIALQYVEGKFSDSHEVTIGGAYLQKQVNLASGTAVKMHIWDTGGADRFKNMTHIFYKDAVAAIIVYDITQTKSLDAVKGWIEELNTNTNISRMTIAIVANKIDLQPANSIIIDQGKQIATEKQALFHQTSAKTGQGINELFKELVETVNTKNYH